MFGDYCEVFSVIWENSLDVDLDDDDVDDAISVGLTFESISADVSGISPQ